MERKRKLCAVLTLRKKKFIDNTFGSFCSCAECRLDDDPIYFNCSFNSGFGFFPQHGRRVTGWNIFLSHSGFGSVCSESSDHHGIPHLVSQLHCVLFGKCVRRFVFQMCELEVAMSLVKAMTNGAVRWSAGRVGDTRCIVAWGANMPSMPTDSTDPGLWCPPFPGAEGSPRPRSRPQPHVCLCVCMCLRVCACLCEFAGLPVSLTCRCEN